MLNTDKFSWASFNVQGSVLTVELKKSKNINKTKSPTNLSAGYDGVIKKIDVKSGTSMVKVGDAVAKGDLLVSGIVENLNSTSYVNSKGTIIAEVIESYSLFEKYEQEKTINIKKYKSAKLLKFYDMFLPLYFYNKPKNSICKTYYKQYYLLGEKTPIGIYKNNYYTFEKKTFIYNKDFIYNDLEQRLNKKISKNNTDFTVVSLDYYNEKIGVKAVATIKTIKNIAKSDKLLINSGKN